MTGFRLILTFAGILLFAGCETSKPGKNEGYYAVTVKQAQVYRFGPAQPTGADAVLKEGHKLLMLRKEYGYSRVMTEDGMTGYISNDYIAPTSPPERPKTAASGNLAMNLPPLPPRGDGTPGVSSANRSVLQTAPLFGGSDLPPLPDGVQRPAFRTGASKPGFRFKVPAPAAPSSDKP